MAERQGNPNIIPAQGGVTAEDLKGRKVVGPMIRPEGIIPGPAVWQPSADTPVQRTDVFQIPPPVRGKFQEITGNLWDYPAQVRVVTTNGTVRRDGKAVMGAGCAGECASMWPDVTATLGAKLLEGGNRVYVIRQEPLLVSFPTKHNFWDWADLNLIRNSALQLKELTERNHWHSVLLPRPGCGLGGKWWLAEVRPILWDILDDRFCVITNGGPTRLSAHTELLTETEPSGSDVK